MAMRTGRSLKAAHPGYIGWEEFMADQRRLAENINRYEAGPHRRAAQRLGAAAGHRNLSALGRRMSLRYSGPHGDYPVLLLSL